MLVAPYYLENVNKNYCFLNQNEMCNCKKITPQSQECYDQMVKIEIPDHMAEYRENRINAGLGKYVSIDPCIFIEIWQLWRNGIHTRGCCCGHNGANPSYVNVANTSIKKMLKMGYIPNHEDISRLDTFALKSV